MFATRFHSFLLAIGLGGALAATLLFNSVTNYVAVSERLSQDRQGRSSEMAERLRTRLQRNLVINCSSGVALLFALGFIVRRFRGHVDAARIESELRMAREVQSALLPEDGVWMSAECTPASEVSGDFYDAFETRGGTAACVIGDVCGKGLPAALLMGVVHGAVRSSEWFTSRRSHEEATSRLNALLCDRLSANRFTSLFWGYHDRGSDVLRYINAGHCTPFLLRRGDTGTEILELAGGGPVLGLLRCAEYQQYSVKLMPGDLLVMYSDGLVEAVNETGEDWGEERLRAALRHCDADKPEALRMDIAAAFKQWLGNRVPQDDCTLVVTGFDVRGVQRRLAPGYAGYSNDESEQKSFACRGEYVGSAAGTGAAA